MSYKQMKTLASFTKRQPIQVLKKSVTSVFFVIDHFSAISTSRAKHTTSYMSHKQMKTLSSFTTQQLFQILKRSVTSVFLSLITSHAISTSRAEHTTSYRGRATTSFISYHQLKTWSLLSKDNQSKSWEKVWEN